MKKIFLLPLLLLFFSSSAQTTLLNESFNVTSRTATPPSGWTTTGTGTNYGGCSSTVTWEQVPSGGFTCSFGYPSPTAHSGSGMAGYNSWDIANGGFSELVTPSLNFSGAGTNTISMWVYNSQFFYLHDSIIVFVNTSATSAGGTRIFGFDPTYNASPTGWVQYTATIPAAYSGTTNYIIFRGQSMYGYDVFFDDVVVTHNPPTPCTGTPVAPSITSSAMSASTPLCAGSSVTINATDPNYPAIGNISYQWQTSSSASGPWTNVTAGTGATTLSYNTGALAASAYFRMAATCTNSSLSAYTAAYLVPVGAPQPGTITGSPTFCPGDASVYSVPNVGATTYTWTLPAGWSGTSTSNSITVTPGNTPGSISVTATSSCGTSIPQTKSVAQGSAPGTPTAINGNNSSCANASQTYSIAAVAGATSYSWTLPTGWSIVSTTNGGLTINVTTSTASGNVVATAVNGCGSSSKSLAVTVVTSLPSPGTISGPTTPCSGALYTYSVSPVLGASSYIWSWPTGWTAVPNGSSLQVFAGTSGGSISVTAYSPCSTSPTSTLAASVLSSVTPTVNVIASDSPICQSKPITFTAVTTNAGSAPVYFWNKNGTPVIGAGATYLDNKLSSGDVIQATLISNATCRTTDTVRSPAITLSVLPLATPGISINATPLITICSGTTVNFTTVATGGGPSPSYQWYKNNSPIAAATSPTYSTASLATNDTITVKMTTSAVCPYVPYAFSNKVGMMVNNVVTPSVTISASSTQPAAGQPITISSSQSGGGNTPVYQWILNGVEVSNATSGTYTSTSFQNGDHIVLRMLSYDPCASPGLVMSNEIIMGNPTSVAGLTNWDGVITLYPNPNSGRFTIASEWNMIHTGKRVSIDLMNMVGQTVYHTDVTPDKTQWRYDVQLSDGIPDGHYMLRLSSTDGMRAAVPVILNR